MSYGTGGLNKGIEALESEQYYINTYCLKISMTPILTFLKSYASHVIPESVGLWLL